MVSTGSSELDMADPRHEKVVQVCYAQARGESYECKASAQERPYASRPSRTQQLFNPKLVPKLTSDVPNDLLQKKGVADQLLAKNAEERGRKRALDNDDTTAPPRKRTRSVSSYSSSSVSTISTNLSRSPSPKRAPPRDGARASPPPREKPWLRSPSAEQQKSPESEAALSVALLRPTRLSSAEESTPEEYAPQKSTAEKITVTQSGQERTESSGRCAQ
ncbi:hypothetical protein H2199_004851 [Coniosporium tulheliwenetii]|uniref:Uncharacterized protein n=1 Tax=Coniosporium tulheliwenetii TaxID=3383036 RepID=A0ACC2Z4C3_9PEZI|nr:hypothetical protein H2199_004851 [Cladosporium sp. JES 115]